MVGDSFRVMVIVLGLLTLSCQTTKAPPQGITAANCTTNQIFDAPRATCVCRSGYSSNTNATDCYPIDEKLGGTYRISSTNPSDCSAKSGSWDGVRCIVTCSSTLTFDSSTETCVAGTLNGTIGIAVANQTTCANAGGTWNAGFTDNRNCICAANSLPWNGTGTCSSQTNGVITQSTCVNAGGIFNAAYSDSRMCTCPNTALPWTGSGTCNNQGTSPIATQNTCFSAGGIWNATISDSRRCLCPNTGLPWSGAGTCTASNGGTAFANQNSCYNAGGIWNPAYYDARNCTCPRTGLPWNGVNTCP